MIFTLIVPIPLFHHHEPNILPGNAISITNFKTFPKANYDCGDCDHVISIHESTIVETISPICGEYNFILYTIIRQLSEKRDFYPIGTIGIIVIVARKMGMQYTLHIKDASIDDEKTIVRSYL